MARLLLLTLMMLTSPHVVQMVGKYMYVYFQFKFYNNL